MATNRTLDTKCPSCYSVLTWNPTENAFKCDYCGSVFNLDDLKKAQIKSAKEDNNVKIELNEIKSGEMDQYLCNNCGAEIMATPETVATKCPYCNNTSILKQKLDSGVYPTKIIPFKKTKEEAIEGFKNISKGKLFAPKNFKDDAVITDVSGVYVPFWIYDITAKGDIIIRGTDTRTWVSGNYSHTETKIFRTTMNGDFEFAKLPVDGSSHFDDGLMDSIEPFEYKDMLDYNHSFLSGFLAEKYDVDQNESFIRAKKRAISSVLKEVKSKTPHQSKIVENNMMNYNLENVEFAMFPVWMVNIEYDGKFYTFAMNGQTGKTVGNIPISVPRAIIFTSLMFILIFAICFGLLVLLGGVL